MKLIDLLNKKANKEELPKKIRLGSHTFILDESAAFYDLYKDEKGQYLFKDYLITLNDEVETIEEDEKPKEIDKIAINENGTIFQMENGLQEIWIAFAYKINELAKAVNYLLQKEDE